MAAVNNQLEAQTIIGDWITGLQAYLSRKLASYDDGEDIVQEPSARLLREHQRGNNVRCPKTHLYQIARNLLYEHYRRNNRHISMEVDPDELACLEDPIDDLADTATRCQQINQTVAGLTPKCQQVFKLRWCEGLRVAEIAEEMSLSRGMVKKNLAQGLAHCKKRL